MSAANNAFPQLRELLRQRGIGMQFQRPYLHIATATQELLVLIKGEEEVPATTRKVMVLHEDHMYHSPEKIAAILQAKVGANRIVFARKCRVQKTDRATAESFLNTYHLMNATQSAYNLGLYLEDELLALASFSKGRKMNRLQEHQRSFELIRFCCKSGITVTGGLTRLVKSFCETKSAGDVMTYVDLELSDGASFMKAGFRKHSISAPTYFLVDRSTFERKPATLNDNYHQETHYLDHNSGNLKMIYSPSHTA